MRLDGGEEANDRSEDNAELSDEVIESALELGGGTADALCEPDELGDSLDGSFDDSAELRTLSDEPPELEAGESEETL